MIDWLEVREFLFARLQEDYDAADLVLRPYGDAASTNDAEWWADEREWFKMGLSSDETPLIMRMTPQRVIQEVKNKRRIVVACYSIAVGGADSADAVLARDACLYTLLMMARVWGDHEDFKDEWMR